MSEAAQEIEVVETPVNDVVEIPAEETTQEQPQEPEQPQQRQFDPKTDKVDFNTPEQQEKFNYVYKQVKMSDARNAMLTEMNQGLLKRLEEVEARFTQTDEAEAERILLGNIKAARDAGDDAREIQATKELVDFKVQKVNQPKPQAKQPEQIPAENSQDFNYIANLVNERDQSGNLARPWLNETHPEFDNTVETLKQISQKYQGDPYMVPKALAELDHVMRAKMTQKPTVPPRAPNPLQGGNLTNGNAKPTIKLTREELRVAQKLGIDPKKYAARRDEIYGGKK